MIRTVATTFWIAFILLSIHASADECAKKESEFTRQVAGMLKDGSVTIGDYVEAKLDQYAAQFQCGQITPAKFCADALTAAESDPAYKEAIVGKPGQSVREIVRAQQRVRDLQARCKFPYRG